MAKNPIKPVSINISEDPGLQYLNQKPETFNLPGQTTTSNAVVYEQVVTQVVTNVINVSMPNGANNEVQFNSGGELSGDTGFSYDASADTLTVAHINANSISLGDVSATHLLGGSNGYALKTDGTGNLRFDPIFPSVSGQSGKVLKTDGIGQVWGAVSYNDLTNTPSFATQTYVNTAIGDLINGAPAALDTLNELANALGNNDSYASTITTALSDKANSSDLSDVAFSGSYNDLTDTPSIPSLTGLATETFVTTQGYVTSSDVATTLTSYASKTYVGEQGFITASTLTQGGYLTTGALSGYAQTSAIPTDISDLTDTTSLLGQGGGADTGNIAFSDTTLTSSNGNIKIHFTPSASPAVEFRFTDSGDFIAGTVKAGSVRGTSSQTAFVNADNVGMAIDSYNQPTTIDIGDKTSWDFVRLQYGTGTVTGNDGDVEIMSMPMGSPAEPSSISISPQGGQNGSFTFGGDGVLTLPNGATFRQSEFNSSATEIIGNQYGWVGLVNHNRENILEVNDFRVNITANNNQWKFENDGTLIVPSPVSPTMTLTFDAAHYVATGPKPTLTLTGAPWELTGEYVYAPDGRSDLALNSIFPTVDNPGYETGDTFAFDASVHGIVGYTLTITLNDVVQAGPAGWTANVTESPAPVYTPTIQSNGAIKLTSDISSWIFGTDGTLTVPGSITMNERLTLNSAGAETGYTAAVLADGNLGRVFVRTLGGEGATLQTWEFNKEGQLMLPFGGDIVDNAGQSVLGGGSGTGNSISDGTSNVSVTSTDGNVVIGVDNDFMNWTFAIDGNIYSKPGRNLILLASDTTGDGYAVKQVVTNGMQDLSLTSLDESSFRIHTNLQGSVSGDEWRFEGNTLQVTNNSTIRAFDANIVTEAVNDGLGGTASLRSRSSAGGFSNIFSTFDATTTSANIKVYNGGSDGQSGYTWEFDNNGNLNVPFNGAIKAGNLKIYPSSGLTTSMVQEFGNLDIRTSTGVLTVGWASGIPEDGNTAAMVFSDLGNIGNAIIRTGNTLDTTYNWVFDDGGNLTLPGNTFAVNYANGAQVSLGGSGATNEITNTDGITNYSVSVATNGVISMVTARGGLEFGALPEPGGPSHFHIMRPAGQNSDLYFGDDYNYVLQRPAAYDANPAYGVEIGANDNDGGSQHVWRFGTTGNLSLPGDLVGKSTLEIFTDSNNNIDLYTNNWIGNGVEVWLQHDDKVSITTDNGNHEWNFTKTGDFNLPNGVTQRSGDFVVCASNIDTVIYTSADQYNHTLKLLLCIEGVEDGQTDLDTQSCEMIVAKSSRNNTVSGSAYGLVYTSANPLVTLTTRWNAVSNRIEVVCRPVSTINSVSVHVSCTELSTSQI